MRSERGQATVEWTGITLLVALVFVALLTAAPAVDGRPLGDAVLEKLVCAVRGSGCAPAVHVRRMAFATASVAGSARASGLFDPHWVPGLNFKRTRSRDAARKLARKIRSGGTLVSGLESLLGASLPKPLVAAIALVAKSRIDGWANHIEDAANKAGPAGVCIHFGVKAYLPMLPGRTTDFDITAWPVGRGGPC